jgi:peptide/nickel transport system permease protein
LVVAIAMAVALVVGLFSGYAGGKVDNVVMRIADGGLSFPPLVLALAVVTIQFKD